MAEASINMLHQQLLCAIVDWWPPKATMNFFLFIFVQ
jgi:hypothetical protein